MANGTAGTSGQVLTSTGNGLSLQSLCSQMGYKKCTTFDYFAGTWTVPSGVTEVMVELWGAGSGGTMNVGGTSGGYLRTVQTVTPGTSISYVVGDGGNGAALLSSDGGSTKVTFPNNLLFAASGGGGIMTNGFKGQQFIGQTPIGGNCFYAPGIAGEGNVHNYGMKTSTTYVETIMYGRGGAPVGTFNPYPNSGDIARYENGVLMYKMALVNNVTPSSGGPAGVTQGYKGGNGLIIFWYN